MITRRYLTTSNISGELRLRGGRWYLWAYHHCEGGYEPLGSFATEDAARERALRYFGNDGEATQC